MRKITTSLLASLCCTLGAALCCAEEPAAPAGQDNGKEPEKAQDTAPDEDAESTQPAAEEQTPANAGGVSLSMGTSGSWRVMSGLYRDNIRTVSTACEDGRKTVSLEPPALVSEVEIGSVSGAAWLAAIVNLNAESSVACLRALDQALDNGDLLIFDRYDYVVVYLAVIRLSNNESPLVQNTLYLMSKAGLLLADTEKNAQYTEPADYMKATLYLLYKNGNAEVQSRCAENLRKTVQEGADPLLKIIAPPPAAPKTKSAKKSAGKSKG